jgi:hypothetical protein
MELRPVKLDSYLELYEYTVRLSYNNTQLGSFQKLRVKL